MMTLPPLSPHERLARQERKRQAILRFLVSETWSTQSLLCRLLHLSPRETARTLAGMVRDDLLISIEEVYECRQIGKTLEDLPVRENI